MLSLFYMSLKNKVIRQLSSRLGELNVFMIILIPCLSKILKLILCLKKYKRFLLKLTIKMIQMLRMIWKNRIISAHLNLKFIKLLIRYIKLLKVNFKIHLENTVEELSLIVKKRKIIPTLKMLLLNSKDNCLNLDRCFL